MGDEPDASRLDGLILEHLEVAGIPTDLHAALRAALEEVARQTGGPKGESTLLSIVRSSGLQVQSRAGGQGGLAARAVPAESKSVDRRAPVDKTGVQGRKWQQECFSSLLVVAFSLVFLPSVTYSQWYIDELFAAVRNADARGEAPLAEVLSHDFWGNPLWDGGWTHKSYRPLVVLSYALQYRFNGGAIKPQPLRAFNVALHACNSLLTYLQARRYAPAHWACLAACLFAVQPVHAENVIYLVGRADALATLCWLLALVAWSWHSPRHGGPRPVAQLARAVLCTLLAVVAGLCKESGFCVLLQLAMLELLGPRPLRSAATPLLVLFSAVFLARSWLTGGTKAGFSYVDTPVQYHSDPTVRLYTYLYFHAKYAQLMVLPWTLSWDYSYDALPLLRETWQDLRVLAILPAYLAVAALACWGASKRSRGILTGLSNVLIPFVPASNLFFLVGVTVGERLLYPCNVGAAILLAALGGRSQERTWTQAKAQRRRETDEQRKQAQEQAPRKPNGRRRLSLRFAMGLAWLLMFTVLCHLRVRQWSDRATLFGPDAAAYPRSTKAQHQFGTVLQRLGRFDEALAHYQASLDLHKDNALTEYCMAQILIETGQIQEALRRFENIFAGHALGFGSFNIYALYVDYGFALMMARRFEEAVAQLAHGLSLNEDVPHGLNALGYSLAQLNRLPEARRAFERGLHYEPDNAYLLNNAGAVRLLAGDLEAGVGLVARAVEAEPSVPAFAHNARVVRVLLDTGQWPPEQLVLELFFSRGN